MGTQAIVNILGGLICVTLGWFLNAHWGLIRDLQQADEKLTDKVNKVEVLVAGQYVSRSEFADALKHIGTKLDKIVDKLDEKADK